MVATFPTIPGISLPVKRTAVVSTARHESINGKRTLLPLRSTPRWEWEIPFDLLRSAAYSTGSFSELETLFAFYLAQSTGGLCFNYFDADDNAATSQQFGIGDGTTTAFQLVRTRGGFAEPVYAPFAPTQLTQIQNQATGATILAPNNQFLNGNAPGSAFTLSGATITTGQTDPNSGTLGGLFAETATTAIHEVYQTQSGDQLAGSPLTFSVYLKQGTSRYCQIAIDGGASNYSGAYANVDMQTGAITATGTFGTPGATKFAATISAASGGFFRAAISAIPDGVSTNFRAQILGVNGSGSATYAPSYLGATGNNFTIAFPQVEQANAVGAPSAYAPTLGSFYYGGPIITVGGTFLDPSAYSILKGAVTFVSAPGAAAALKWSGTFYWLCRFTEDTFEETRFNFGMHDARSLKFASELVP